MRPPLLAIENVRAGYGPIAVLKDVSLHVEAGEIVTLIGANGAGKSTLLMCISGIARIGAGRIRFGDEDIHTLSPHRIVARGISQVPEGRRIFPRLTVYENLQMGAYIRRDSAGIRTDLDRVYALFPILAERRRQPAGTLSGGEQQMLALARACMARPQLLILDEPSLGLAPLVCARIFDVIRDLNRQGATILLVEQNARMALKLAQRAYVMETGAMIMADRAEILYHDPRIQAAYLGGAATDPGNATA